MIHLYLSMGDKHPRENDVVDQIIGSSAGVGLIQAAAADDELTRQVAEAHIDACEGMLAVVTGAPGDDQVWEIRAAGRLGVPVLVVSQRATVDAVEGRPVRNFSVATFLEFVDALPARR